MFGRYKRWFIRLTFHILSDRCSLFLFSLLVGILLGTAYHHLRQNEDNGSENIHLQRFDSDRHNYLQWLKRQDGKVSVPVDPDISRYLEVNRTDNNDPENPIRPGSEARYLYEHVSVACLLFPDDVERAITVRNTWGKHCNKIYFFHHKNENASVPVKRIKAKSSFGLLCNSLHDVRRDFPDPDWVLVATEDTFALLENFRYYAASLNSSEPQYIGHAMTFWNQVYNWADAGYAINRVTMNKLLDKFDTQEKCSSGGKYFKNGDWYLGKHLDSLGIRPIDTRDHEGKGRFNGYSFRKLLFPGAVSLFERYWRDSLYFSPDGPACCSDHAITFHGIASNSKMYQLEYMFYHLRSFPHGGVHGNSPAPVPQSAPHLTVEEKLKEEELEKWFNSQLTTPKNMAELYKHIFGEDGLHKPYPHQH